MMTKTSELNKTTQETQVNINLSHLILHFNVDLSVYNTNFRNSNNFETFITNLISQIVLDTSTMFEIYINIIY